MICENTDEDSEEDSEEREDDSRTDRDQGGKEDKDPVKSCGIGKLLSLIYNIMVIGERSEPLSMVQKLTFMVYRYVYIYIFSHTCVKNCNCACVNTPF